MIHEGFDVPNNPITQHGEERTVKARCQAEKNTWCHQIQRVVIRVLQFFLTSTRLLSHMANPDPDDVSEKTGSLRHLSVDEYDNRILGSRSIKCFIRWLSDKLMLNTSDTETSDIEMAVKEFVERILRLGVRKDTRFEAKLQRTGSSYDGTKIKSPDEFDFLAVMGRFSNSNCESVVRSCADSQGFAHVHLKKTSANHWQDLLTDRCELVTKHFRDRFRTICHEVIQETKDVVVEKPSGFLLNDGYEVSLSGPQCIVKFIWRSGSQDTININVDICPTIEYPRVDKVLTVDDAANREVYQTLTEFGHVFLIPRPRRECSLCFKLVFAEADRTVIQDLSDCHKRCLLILKHIASETSEDIRLRKVFNSFALKMAVLHHSFQCRETEDCQKCIVNIFKDLITRLEKPNPNMPSVFIMKHNVWRNVFKFRGSKEISVNLLIQLTDFFRTLPLETVNEGVYEQKLKELNKLCRRSSENPDHDSPS